MPPSKTLQDNEHSTYVATTIIYLHRWLSNTMLSENPQLYVILIHTSANEEI